MQGTILTYKKSKYSKQMKKKSTHTNLHTKLWQEKIILLHKILSSIVHKGIEL
jgi:hypothetical protein